MPPFRFRLARVLDYQRTRLAIEEQALERLSAERRRLEADRDRADAERLASARTLATRTDLQGFDFECLDAYSSRMERQKQTIEASIQDCGRRSEHQRAVVLEARRKVRLLEKLRERSQADWTAELNRELEALASEFTVSQSSRSRQNR